MSIPHVPATTSVILPRNHRRRSGLHGLSALAIVLLLLSHASGGEILPGGFVGLDVFFVVSGYLVTERFLRIALREGTVSSKTLLAEVFAHRARTLLPLSTLVLLVVAVAVILVYPSTEWEALGLGITAGAFFLENWLLARQVTAIPSGVAGIPDLLDNPLLHYWAIAVDLQFFVLWTAILMVMVFLARPQSTRSTGRSRWRLRPVTLRHNTAWAAIILTGLSLIWAALLTTADPGQTFFHTTTRVWELGIGAILGAFATQLNRTPHAVGHLASVIGLLGILGAAWFFDISMDYPGYFALIPTLGAAAMIIGTLANPGLGMEKILDSAPVRWLSGLSLSLYLWHWPVLVIGGYLLGTTPTVGQGMMLVAGSVIPAWVSHHFIAEWVLRWPAVNRNPTNALSMGVLLLLTSFLVGMLLLTAARF